MPRLRSIDRKLSRSHDHRRLMLKTLATQLVMHKSLTTSKSRAQAVVPYVERLVAKAKKGGLYSRRYVRARLDTVEATHELTDVIAPQMKRESGFLKKERAGFKSGDHTPMVRITFVDTITQNQLSAESTSAAGQKSAPTAASPQKRSTSAKKSATPGKNKREGSSS